MDPCIRAWPWQENVVDLRLDVALNRENIRCLFGARILCTGVPAALHSKTKSNLVKPKNNMWGNRGRFKIGRLLGARMRQLAGAFTNQLDS